MTGMQVYGLMNQNKALLNQLKDMTEARGYSPEPAKASKPSAYADPEPAPEPSPEPPPVAPSGTVEYFEPEEAPEVQKKAPVESYTQYEVLDDLQPEPVKTRTKKSRVVESKPMPEFGDAELLAHMENVAKSSNRRRKK
jgi:pilus assembly protein FimV